MNRKQKIQRIIDALPSYKKTQGCLGRDAPGEGKCFCIQGVICDLYSKETGDTKRVKWEWWQGDVDKLNIYHNEKDKHGSQSSIRRLKEAKSFSGLTDKELQRLMYINDLSHPNNWNDVLLFLEQAKEIE